MIPEIKVWIFYDISSNLSGKIPYNSIAYQSTKSWYKAREAAKVVSLPSKNFRFEVKIIWAFQ